MWPSWNNGSRSGLGQERPNEDLPQQLSGVWDRKAGHAALEYEWPKFAEAVKDI
jgi:hypothetical protein